MARNGDTPFKLPGSDSPLKKSTSVSAIIHGAGTDTANKNYYIDSLQRFHRDFASVDKQERDYKKQQDTNVRERKRNNTIQRQLSLKRLEDSNVQKMRDRQTHSLFLHEVGAKMTIHSHGSAVDPVTLNYERTERGRQQQRYDSEKQINGLVRSHKLQTWGTSGYNIINGQKNLTVQEMVPQDNYGLFQNKLSNYYQKFRVRPEQ